MCEAFCCIRTATCSSPTRSFTARPGTPEPWQAELGVKNLLLYHTEDKTLATRRTEYAREAAQSFKGNIFVPDDLETIDID